MSKVSTPRRLAGKKLYHHGDLRRALIATALKLVEEQDTSSLTLREVARRAGVTHGAPYHHFPNKNALLAVLAEEGFRALYTEQLQAVAKVGADPMRRLEALGVSYVTFAARHPGHFRVMYGLELLEWSEYPALLEAATLTFMLLTQTAEETLRTHHAEGSVMDVVLAAWSVVHGLATLWVDGPLRHLPALTGEVEIRELAARVVRLSTSALKPL